MLNIVCTSKPGDGLLFYSYEYCSHLNEKGISAQVYVVTHRDFTSGDYTQALSDKYIHCENIVFNNDYVEDNCISLIMGRSMLTLAHMTWNDYRPIQQESLKKLFGNKLISVYSENHPEKYPLALEFFNPKRVIDLCDTDVYPNGVGAHFEKIIHFPIYKEVKEDIQFDHLFLGTNPDYYKTVQKVIDKYPDHGILTYPQKYLDLENNNLRCPVDNLLGKFKTYVYTKNTFDPAPRLFQEARWLGKEIIYLRDDEVKDGGYWYWKRGIKQQDLSSMITAIDAMNGKIALETKLAVREIVSQIGSLERAPTPIERYLTNYHNIKSTVAAQSEYLLFDLLKESPTFWCPHFFDHIHTNTSSNYSVCCVGQITDYKYSDMTPSEWYHGEILTSCRKASIGTGTEADKKVLEFNCQACIKAEKLYGKSERTDNIKVYTERPSNESIKFTPMQKPLASVMKTYIETGEVVLEPGLIRLQLRIFGNTCNLDCYMCQPQNSSVRYNSVGKSDEFDVIFPIENDRIPIVLKDHALESLDDMIPYIKTVTLQGGEPLFIKHQFKLLDKLVKLGVSKNIYVDMNTNGTILGVGKNNILDYAEHFKKLQISISLDGFGKYNDYIRRRSVWADIVDNINTLKKVPNVWVSIFSTLSVLSILRMDELIDFADGMGLEQTLFVIDDPSELNPNVLPEKLKEVLRVKYRTNQIILRTLDKSSSYYGNNAKRDQAFNKALDYLVKTDKEYRTNVFELYPELKEYYSGKAYAIELPQITGVVDSVKDFHKEILKKEPKGEVWYEGITHHRIPKDHEIYNIINKELFHTSEEETNWSGKLDPEEIKAGKHVAEVRAYLSEQKGGISFVPHVDSGYVLIFPFKIEKDSNYKLQYLNHVHEVVYEHEYRKDDNGDVIGILHNGPSYQHTVRWDSPKDKWWVQIILNPKEGGWKELCEHVENNNLFKGDKHGSIRITR